MASLSTAVHGYPYPSESDTPDVASDLQALALAVELATLSPAAVSTSQTLQAGRLAIATAAPITLTLPTAAENAMVGVFVRSGSGSAPVTVQTSGASIYGAGLNGASLKLGAIGAYVVLISDGTNWYVVAGEQDTGWQAITLSSGFASVGGYTPGARVRGDTAALRGAIGSNGTNINWGTVPAAAKPASTVIPLGAGVGNPSGQVSAGTPGSLPSPFISVGTTGVITGSGITIPSGYSLGLDGLTYPLS